MANNTSVRKILSVIKSIRSNALYHYSSRRFPVLRYLYFAMFRINKFLVFERDHIVDVPPVQFEPPFHIEIKTDADELRRICDAYRMPRECYYGDILGLHLCFLVYHADEIALLYWLSLPGEYSRFLKLNKGTAEIYYVSTLPKFRGMGLPTKTALFACRYLSQAGYRKAAIVTHEMNVASIKTVVRAGFKRVRSITSIGPFNLKIRI
jgi:RimJ/RimL family protein N-acetyltransferase